MKSIKSLLMYLIIFIFILSLTASFEGSVIVENDLKDLSLANKNMKMIFYDTYKTDDEVVVDEENQITEYALGSTGDEVLIYEKILYYTDYLKKDPDGNFDETTKTAVLAYQEEQGLETNGTMDAATITALLDEEITYRKGQKGEEILKYQMILYYIDELTQYPNGEFGDATVAAVTSYQGKNGLEATGAIDQATLLSLAAEAITYKQGKKGEVIEELQNRLKTLGYLTGEVDGQYGSKTVEAVKKFQADKQITQTGEIDPQTAKLIEQK
ncbi:MAG: peptidoglycan-binding protein [Eubacteriaceae bacterium]|nr:peptidoglycan-binding protein [Eubacteriaceae bacterium]